MLRSILRSLLLWALVLSATGCGRDAGMPGTTDGSDDYTRGEVTVMLDDSGSGATRAGWIYDEFFPPAAPNREEQWYYNGVLVVFNSKMLLECYAVYDYTYNGTQNGTNTYVNSNGEYTTFTLGFNASAGPGGGDLRIKTGLYYFYFFSNVPKNLFADLSRLEQEKGVMTKDEFEKRILRSDDESGRTADLISNGSPFHTWDQNLGTPEGISRGFMVSNITSPQPRYLYSLEYTDSGGYPVANGFKLQSGRASAKVSVAYVADEVQDGEIYGKLSEIKYQVVNIPTQMYIMPNIFDGVVYTPHYDEVDESFDYGSDRYRYLFDGIDAVSDEKWKSATTRASLDANIERDSLNCFYCMENSNAVPTQGNSTFALVRARFEPAQWLDKDGSPASNGTSDGTFWRVKNEEGVFQSGYYNEVPLNVASGWQVVKYDKGITYYPVWLKTGGKYEVRRNGLYKIAVTKVAGAGAPDLQSVIAPGMKLDDPDTRGMFHFNNTGIEWQQEEM